MRHVESKPAVFGRSLSVIFPQLRLKLLKIQIISFLGELENDFLLSQTLKFLKS